MSKLYTEYQPGTESSLPGGKIIQAAVRLPTLVFLHGLLGSGRDWSSTLACLAHFPRLTIDLCGHGHSRHCSCRDFDDCCDQVADAIADRLSPDTPCVMIGYSLGGRLTMYGCVSRCWSGLNLKGVVVEGGHFGLTDESLRQTRWHNDQHWAKRYQNEAIEHVLNDWYRQPVFSSLNHAQRQHLLLQRRDNLGTDLAKDMLAKVMLATSLARQPDLSDALRKQSVPVQYICGEKDQKFRQLAQSRGWPVTCVPQAGHNAHQEQPSGFARCIETFVDVLR
jgi:2-succinyl-6-hydroxy-2,4-cyclohexadiene-1-carboxylate synthase